MREAQTHAEEDKKKKEQVEARNMADNMIYTAEKAIRDAGDKVSAEIKTEVEDKIKKYAFSGGGSTIKEHKEKGGNPDIDVSYQYLRMFFEPNDHKLKKIYDDYKSGKLLTSEIKEILIVKLNKFLEEHQDKREEAKDKLREFMLKN